MSTGSTKRKAVGGPTETPSPPPTKRKLESSTTQKNVAEFFKPASAKQPEQVSWRIIDKSLLIAKYARPEKETPRESRVTPVKIAAYDLDSTLITTKSGNRFARDAGDWKWWDPTVPGTLRRVHDEGCQLVIFSNQGSIALTEDPKTLKGDKKRLADFKTRISAVLHALDLPISLYAATTRDLYRKPNVGMWETFLDDYDLEASGVVDKAASVFVGDAGGRLKDAKNAADFSSSDRDFATNAGLAYSAPEEHFRQEEPRPFRRMFDPSIYMKDPEKRVGDPGQAIGRFEKKNDRDIVLLCGSPASGKSTFYFKHLQPLGYERVNQDLLKSRAKCEQRARESLEIGRSVAVDNTNADAETRRHWVRMAEQFGIAIRCVRLSSDAALCQHNDSVRSLHEAMNPEKRSKLPQVAFRSFASRFEEPKMEEGFQDISVVDFEFEGTAEQQSIWRKYHV